MTISVAVSLSSINALTLSPALCALLLKPGTGLAKRGPLHWFNLAFEKTRVGYNGVVRLLLRRFLAKDVTRRPRDVGFARVELTDALRGDSIDEAEAQRTLALLAEEGALEELGGEDATT